MATHTTDAQGYAAAFLAAMQESWQAQLHSLEQALAEGTVLRAKVRAARQDEAELHSLLAASLPEGTAPAFINLAAVLILENRLPLIPDIARELQTHLAGTATAVKAQITSAAALAAEQQTALREALEAEHGRELDVQFLVDPSLIGGMRIRVGDSLTDLSVSSRLQSLREEVLSSF